MKENNEQLKQNLDKNKLINLIGSLSICSGQHHGKPKCWKECKYFDSYFPDCKLKLMKYAADTLKQLLQERDNI